MKLKRILMAAAVAGALFVPATAKATQSCQFVSATTTLNNTSWVTIASFSRTMVANLANVDLTTRFFNAQGPVRIQMFCAGTLYYDSMVNDGGINYHISSADTTIHAGFAYTAVAGAATCYARALMYSGSGLPVSGKVKYTKLCATQN